MDQIDFLASGTESQDVGRVSNYRYRAAYIGIKGIVVKEVCKTVSVSEILFKWDRSWNCRLTLIGIDLLLWKRIFIRILSM